VPIASDFAIVLGFTGLNISHLFLNAVVIGEDVTDQEIIEGIKLLATTEGIFTETAGGVTIAVTKKLIEQGVLPKDESIVVSITGNGLKTQEAIVDDVSEPHVIGANLEEFEELYDTLKS